MKRFLTAALLVTAVLNSTFAFAEDWPAKPIRLVVPYAAGGYTDAVGRIAARFMEKEFGQTVIVDNRAGGGGIVGSDLVSKSPGDGYTLCVCSVGAISIAPVAQTTAYDPIKSFKTDQHRQHNPSNSDRESHRCRSTRWPTSSPMRRPIQAS